MAFEIYKNTRNVKLVSSAKTSVSKISLSLYQNGFKNTHKGKAPSNKTPALTKSTNISIWVVGTTNQLFVILKLKQSFQKK